MAESLLKNWRWQWFYRHKQDIGKKDYKDIQNLDEDVPDDLKEDYLHQLQELEHKIEVILDNPVWLLYKQYIGLTAVLSGSPFLFMNIEFFQ